MSSGGLGRLHAQGCVKTALSPALSVAVSPDRKQFAVGYHSDSVNIYNIDNGKGLGRLIWLVEKHSA